MIPPLHSVGRVAGKHGFSGEISIALLRDVHPGFIKKGNFLFIEFDGKGVPFLIAEVKGQQNIIKLTDINTSDAADELEGRTILSEAHLLNVEDTPDLLGFELRSGGVAIGPITGIAHFPAGIMLTVNYAGGEILIPWVEDWIVEIDPDNHRIDMELPEGLLNLE